MRDIKDFTILILPGVGGSGTEHWQTAWEKAFPCFQRVEQAGLGRAFRAPLPFPSGVVASRDDDRVSFDRAEAFAVAWGSTLIDAGNHGHLGSAAQLGVWPSGLLWFGQFLA